MARVPRATLALGGATVAVFVAQHLSGTDTVYGLDRVRVALGYQRDLLLDGQVWRAATPTFLHISGELFRVTGLPHILVNMSQLAILGPWAENVWDGKRLTALYLISGTVAFGWLVLPNPEHNFAGGGSGGLYGVIGALLIRALSTKPSGTGDRVARVVLGVLALTHAWFNIRPLFGAHRGYWAVAPLVHLGGFTIGVALGALFAKRDREAATDRA